MNEGYDTKAPRDVDELRPQLPSDPPSRRRRLFEKFFLAALGSIPWIGGFLSAAASFALEDSGADDNSLQTQWLAQHQTKIDNLMASLDAIAARFETLGAEIDERIQSEEYLTLVRRAFRVWDHADTDEKRKYIGNLVSNAAGTRAASDDVVRLFIDWLDQYDEAHFAVIRQIYQRPRSTRYEIWNSLYGPPPREDSADADLFRLLIRDLSTGGVIRQERTVTVGGYFLRQPKAKAVGRLGSEVLESSFETTKPYVLTALGEQFVHYTMNEVVMRIEGGPADGD